MSLYRQPRSPLWYVDFVDATGKRVRRSTSTADREEAQLIHDEWSRQARLEKFGLLKPEASPPPIPQVLLSAFAAKYEKYQRATFRPKSAEGGRSAFRSLRLFFGQRDPILADVTTGDIEAWKVWLLERRSRTTTAIYWRALRTAWRRAVAWGDAPSSPFDGSERPREEYDTEMPRYFEEEELARLFAACRDTRFAAMLRIYLYTGMRRNELIYLQWLDVDLDVQQITVVGLREVSGRMHRTKTGRQRIIPIAPRLLSLLQGLLEARRSNRTLKACLWVFPAQNSRGTLKNTPWDGNAITRKFRLLVAAAGLPPALSLHSLRHTFASRLVQRGVSLYAVGELLGHTSLEVTRIYSHLTPKSLAPLVEGLDFEA